MNQIATPAVARRGFLTGALATGGGLMIGTAVPVSGRAATVTTKAVTTSAVNAFVVIGSDDSITILSSGAEMGQGVLSSMPQILAEELMVDWTRVKTAPAPSGAQYLNPVTHSQSTGGSNNMRSWFKPLLKIGAAAREMLVRAAATSWGVTVDKCTVANGVITNTAVTPNVSLSYGAVAAAAALLPVPQSPTLLSATTGYRLIGKPILRPDIPSKVNGSAIFGIDVRIPGMVYAAIKNAPLAGSTVKSVGAAPSGSQAVNLGDSVAVTGANTWAAFQNARSISVQWTPPAGTLLNTSAAIDTKLVSLIASGPAAVGEKVGDLAAAMAGAKQTVSMTYDLPYLAHACMEVLNATANVTATSCEVWAPTQGADLNLYTAMALTGLTADKITIHPTLLGGGLGRKFEQDFVAQAIKASQALGKPVHLTWSREEDFGHDLYRPVQKSKVTVGLDAGGNILGWNNRIAAPSVLQTHFPKYVVNGLDTAALAGATGLFYKMNARLVDYAMLNANVPVGFWRSVGESANVFVIESAIDEVAAAAGKDPLAYRQAMITDSCALAVLNAAATAAGWGTKPAAGHARGIAVYYGFGSYVAQVVEIAQATATTIKVVRVCCAIDCGQVVNPDTLIAQMQGGIVHGLSAAMWGQVTFANGAASVRNFNNYPLVRMPQMPKVDVQIVNTPGAPIGGAGEAGVPAVAPALANAYFALTGTRLRKLPLLLAPAPRYDD